MFPILTKEEHLNLPVDIMLDFLTQKTSINSVKCEVWVINSALERVHLVMFGTSTFWD